MFIIKRIKSIISTTVNLFVLRFHIKYINLLKEHLEDCKNILDLGCGNNSPIGRIKNRNMYTMGVDIFEKYIELSKNRKIHDDHLIFDILQIDKKISPKSFDCVVLLDVIEHLDKIEGIKLVQKIERIAKKKIIIFTPNGFLHQQIYHNNIYQIHKSGWNMNLFKKMNFKVYGVNGLKYLRGELLKIKYRPEILWEKIALSSNLFVKYFPQFATQLLCIKDL